MAEMEPSGAYNGIFPKNTKSLDILQTLPIATATVHRSFSLMKDEDREDKPSK